MPKMKNPGKTFIQRQQKVIRYIRIGVAALVAACIVGAIFVIRIKTTAGSERSSERVGIRTVRPAIKPTPEGTPVSPQQTPATRIRIIFGEKHDLQIATGVDSFVLISPEIASAEIKNRFTLTISAL